jgi:methylglutaconyl-CoA hydratase
MATTDVTLYSLDDGAAWITLNRPEARNALSSALIGEVYAHLEAANADSRVRCIVVTGAGSAFCSGADLKDSPGEMVHSARVIAYPELLAAIQDSPKPVLAAVNGPAFAGGLGLIGAADIVIAADNAVFSFSEVRIGVIPAVISVVCLPKLGRHHGMKLFLTGERFSAARGIEVGLVHLVVPAAQLNTAVSEQVEMIRQGGPNAVVECKRLVRRIPELSRDDAFAETAPWSARLFASNEAQEGMAAFREKRQPLWLRAQ